MNITQLKKQLSATTTELDDLKADNVISQAIREGRIAPAQKEAMLLVFKNGKEDASTLISTFKKNPEKFKVAGTGAESAVKLEGEELEARVNERADEILSEARKNGKAMTLGDAVKQSRKENKK